MNEDPCPRDGKKELGERNCLALRMMGKEKVEGYKDSPSSQRICSKRFPPKKEEVGQIDREIWSNQERCTLQSARPKLHHSELACSSVAIGGDTPSPVDNMSMVRRNLRST